MANVGYGKRTASGEGPRTERDFAGLPQREGAVAGYIDRLPEGADISVKTLAKVLPYGQCALRTALNHLQRAGHLRRGREHLLGSGGSRWVTRTFFSRTARDDDWWAAFTRGDVPTEPQRPARSRAFVLLAALGRTAPALSVSAAECAALEPLVTTWFERGFDERRLTHVLTDGLPAPVHHAAALLRNRLTAKMPPEPVPATTAVAAPPRPLRMLECGLCRAPGGPDALTDGVCGQCRGESAPAPAWAAGTLPPDEIRSRVAAIRAGMGRPGMGRTVASRTVTVQADADRAGAGRTVADQADAGRAGADRTDADQLTQAGQAQTGPTRTS
ncbi:hypothetical protein [Streptomyces sp. AM 4-1-1]|uniref:hypothetical protein n=1 Tax=Streptomyces sp. AM 4-1-1 TaxID=3028710 RepID=UPI0031BABE17